MLRFDVLTIFPGILRGALEESILKRAREKGLVEVRLHDFREWSEDKHKKVDDRPYGGGPGMVIRCGPVCACFEAAIADAKGPVRRILLTPQGRRFDQGMARELSREARVALVCGRYEGVDERVREALDLEEVSIGDYVLSGGEVAALAVIEATVRLIPGALGDQESAERDSFEEGAEGLLCYPQYTRPPVFRGMAVPEVLLSGDHGAVERWRREQARGKTAACRTDLLARGSAAERDEATSREGKVTP